MKIFPLRGFSHISHSHCCELIFFFRERSWREREILPEWSIQGITPPPFILIKTLVITSSSPIASSYACEISFDERKIAILRISSRAEEETRVPFARDGWTRVDLFENRSVLRNVSKRIGSPVRKRRSHAHAFLLLQRSLPFHPVHHVEVAHLVLVRRSANRQSIQIIQCNRNSLYSIYTSLDFQHHLEKRLSTP